MDLTITVKAKKIIVIPVNRCFDLSCENNLISEGSIHGQWLENYITSEKNRDELHQKIESYLADHNANSTEIDYFKALQNLVDYYDSHGQCVYLYCPVFGDHIIRPTRPTEDVLHFMISTFKINKLKIHGRLKKGRKGRI